MVTRVKANVPQGSILGTLFCNNDLSVDRVPSVKLFVDDTLLLCIIHDTKTSTYELISKLFHPKICLNNVPVCLFLNLLSLVKFF